MHILSRTDAISCNSHLYFTGKPCKNGHLSERYTKTCVCVQCNRTNALKVTRQMNLAAQGVMPITLRARASDHPALLAYCDMLNAAHGIENANATTRPAKDNFQPPAPVVKGLDRPQPATYVPAEFRRIA